MAVAALTDATVWINNYDWSGESNSVEFEMSAEELDATVFGPGGTRVRAAGLRDVGASIKGFMASDASNDAIIAGTLGQPNKVMTVANSSAEGSVAYMALMQPVKYTAYGEIGALTPFMLDLSGSGPQGVARGKVSLSKQNVTGAGRKGTAVYLGAVGASQYLYATVHCFTAGTTITLKVQSDDNAGFTSPTDQITLSAITTTGGTWVTRLAGPITDTYYQFGVASNTGTFNLAGAIGIA